MNISEPLPGDRLESIEPPKRPRRRLRRRLWAAGLLLFLTAGLGSAYRYLQSALFQQNLQDWVLPYLSQALSADIRCRRLQVDLFSGQANIEGLTLSKKGGQVPSFLEIEKVEARFQWGLPWGNSRFALGSVRIEKPLLRLHLLGNEKDNLPRSSAPRGKGRLVETIFRASFQLAEIRNGIVELRESRIPIEMALHDLQLELDMQQKGLYLGNLRFRNGDLKIHRWKAEALDLDSKIEFLPQGVRFAEGWVRYGPSEVRFSGQLDDFYSPNLDFAFEAKASMEHIQDSFQLNPLFSGPVQATGRLLLQNGQFQTTGKFSSSELRFQGLTARQAEGDFELAKSRLTLNSIQTAVLGGRAEGKFYYDWGQEKPSARGEFLTEGLSLQKALADLIKMDWPTSTRVQGNLLLGWDGEAADWHLDAQVNLIPPASSSNGIGGSPPGSQLDPSGPIDFTVDHRTAQINHLMLSFPLGSQLKASGYIGIGSPSSLSVDFLSPHLGESLQLVRQFTGAKDLLQNPGWMPSTLQEIRFEGEMSGMVGNPSLEGTIEIGQPEWRFSAWDSFRAIVHRTPGKLSFDSMSLSGPGGEIVAAMEMPPEKPDNANWCLRGAGRDLKMDSLLGSLLKGDLIQGRAEANFELCSQDQLLLGNVKAALPSASAVGLSLGTLESGIRLENNRVEWEIHSAGDQPQSFAAKGSYLIDNGDYTLEGKSSALPFSQISYLSTWKDRLDGRLELSFRGEGHLQKHSIQGEIRSPSVSLLGQGLEALESKFLWSGQEVQWSGKGSLPAGKLGWDSTIRWDTAAPVWNAQVQVDHFDLLRLAPEDIKNPGSSWNTLASGRIAITGPFLQPAQWVLEALFPSFDLTFNTLNFRAQQPLKGRFSSGKLDLEKTGFTTRGGQLTISGSVDTNSTTPLNLRISSQLDLKPFESWMGGAIMDGKSNLEISLQGSPQAPRLRGTCRLEGVHLSVPGIDYAIDNLGGDLFFDGNTLRASNVRGSFAGGTLTASGSAQLERAVLSGFLLNIRLGKVQLRVPQGFRTISNAELAWRGNLERHNLSGEIRVQEAEYNRHTDLFRDFGVLFPLSKTGSRKQDFLDRLALDLQIRFDNGLEIRTDTLRLMADSSLRLLGPASNISLLGRISATSGELTFLGNNYEITKGGVEFVNPLHIEPIFDLSAATNVHGYRINLQLTGRPDSIKPDIRSEPPLPMLDLLTLLSTGVTSQELMGRASEGGNVGMAASSLLAQGLSQQVESRMQRLLGFRQFRIDPYLSSRSNNPTARVTLERRVTKNLSLTYSTDLTSAEQHIILVEYYFSPDYSLIASRDEKGDYGLDLRIQRRF